MVNSRRGETLRYGYHGNDDNNKNGPADWVELPTRMRLVPGSKPTCSLVMFPLFIGSVRYKSLPDRPPSIIVHYILIVSRKEEHVSRSIDDVGS